MDIQHQTEDKVYLHYFTITCSFWENLAKLYVGASYPEGRGGGLVPHLREILYPALIDLSILNMFVEIYH